MAQEVKAKSKISKIRKVYIARLVGRCIVLLIAIAWFICRREDITRMLQGWQFFKEFSIMHLLWIVWLIDMICQLIPVKNHISIGSQKLFKERFRPITDKIKYQALR